LFLIAVGGQTALGSCFVTATARLLKTEGTPGPPDIVPPTPEEIRRAAIAANTQRLKVTITMDRQEYVRSGAAEVKVLVVNPTTDNLEVWDPFREYVENKFVTVQQPYWECGPAWWVGSLAAGEAIERTYHLVVPDAPGDYKLFVNYPIGERVSYRVAEHPFLTERPILLSISEDGRGQGAILHAGTSRVVSSSDPAQAGEALEIYATGLVYGCAIPYDATIGNVEVEILYFGNARGLAGKDQVNVRVPYGLTPGPEVSVRLKCANGESNEVTIGVQ
jgi:hypothetical protein